MPDRIPGSRERMEFPGFTADNLSKTKAGYLAAGPEPSNTRYGWIRTTATP